MNIDKQKEQLDLIKKIKTQNNYQNKNLKELKSLPGINGVIELSFKKHSFFMLNIFNDDAIPLKYLWRNGYENLSLEIWYKITRKEGIFFDIGAHTGLYSIIGNLGNDQNNIISIEAFYMNYARLISNLRLNKILANNCLLRAASNKEGISNFHVPTSFDYHTTGGSVNEKGKLKVSNITLDNFKLNKKICGIKIDTEGYEYNIILGGINVITKNKPDIIFEINKNNFDQCLSLLTI